MLDTTQAVYARARAVAEAGGVDAALDAGTLPERVDVRFSEALVLGLLKQGVRKYLAVFGHGSTDLAEVLRVYEDAGATRTWNFRNEVEMAHAATALRWVYGEPSAVVTSIGPGALQAMAGSLAAASNGVGVYHVYGDETTHDEGFNMQQIPKHEQGLYARLTATMGASYALHTPGALRAALRRGAQTVFHPYKAGPFYLLFPINMQPVELTGLNLRALPERLVVPPVAVADPAALDAAAALVRQYRRIVIKAGGGARAYGTEVAALAEAVDGVVALSPGALGVLPDAHPRNMHVGGSKGTVSGNHAMREAELLIVVGSRAVCQADCSGIGYEKAQAVININADLADLTHYNRTVGLPGDIGAVIRQLLEVLRRGPAPAPAADWRAACGEAKHRWAAFRREVCEAEPLDDAAFGRPVLTQPAALHVVAEFARRVDAVKYFDAGDVQANGFQVVQDDQVGDTFTETGASYMGFAACALLASALAEHPRYAIAFSGDGSFMMNPQVLIDAVEHGVHGTIVILDNRRMAAITALQQAQYGAGFRTGDSVAVDYVALAAAVPGVRALYGGDTREALKQTLAEAHAHPGLSVIHVPVYHGPDPRGGLGAYGDWNVGSWVDAVQARYHDQDL